MAWLSGWLLVRQVLNDLELRLDHASDRLLISFHRVLCFLHEDVPDHRQLKAVDKVVSVYLVKLSRIKYSGCGCIIGHQDHVLQAEDMASADNLDGVQLMLLTFVDLNFLPANAGVFKQFMQCILNLNIFANSLGYSHFPLLHEIKVSARSSLQLDNACLCNERH